MKRLRCRVNNQHCLPTVLSTLPRAGSLFQIHIFKIESWLLAARKKKYLLVKVCASQLPQWASSRRISSKTNMLLLVTLNPALTDKLNSDIIDYDTKYCTEKSAPLPLGVVYRFTCLPAGASNCKTQLTCGSECSGPGDPGWQSSHQPHPAQT